MTFIKLEESDIAIFNTCHIREKAAEKLFSDLGNFKYKENKIKSGALGLLLLVALHRPRCKLKKEISL